MEYEIKVESRRFLGVKPSFIYGMVFHPSLAEEFGAINSFYTDSFSNFRFELFKQIKTLKKRGDSIRVRLEEKDFSENDTRSLSESVRQVMAEES